MSQAVCYRVYYHIISFGNPFQNQYISINSSYNKDEEEVVDVSGLYPHLEVEKLHKDDDLRISLEDSDLWRSFHSITNEMIVTKNGRYCAFLNIYLLFYLFLFHSIRSSSKQGYTGPKVKQVSSSCARCPPSIRQVTLVPGCLFKPVNILRIYGRQVRTARYLADTCFIFGPNSTVWTLARGQKFSDRNSIQTSHTRG